jgi:hypothetical protein
VKLWRFRKVSSLTLVALFLSIALPALSEAGGGAWSDEFHQEWTKVLELFAARTPESEQCVRQILEATSFEPVRALCEQVLSEWTLALSDRALLQPRLVYRPALELPSGCTDAEILRRGPVVLEVDVAEDGSTIEARVLRTNPDCPQLAELARSLAERFLFRPSCDESGLLKSTTVWVLRIDPQ